MSIDLRYFHKCDHTIVAETLYVDPGSKIAELASPAINSGITLYENNIVEQSLCVIRGIDITDNLYDMFGFADITEITDVYQSSLSGYEMTRTQFKSGIDFILRPDRVSIEWLESSPAPPLVGSLYRIDLIHRKKITSWKLLNSFNVFIPSFSAEKTYDIDYYTEERYCPQCRYDGVSKDFRISQIGDVETVFGDTKLKQDVIKLLLTNIETNPFFPTYGTSIEKSIGTAAVPEVLEATLTEEINNGIATIQRMQQEQSTYQTLTPEETLYNILGISVEADGAKDSGLPGNPTLYRIDLDLQNAARKTLDIFVPTSSFENSPKVAPSEEIIIKNIAVLDLTDNRCTIRWDTNVPTATVVEYGKDQTFRNRVMGESGTRHFVYLDQLDPATVYYYRIVTISGGFTLVSKTRNFETDGY